MSAAGRVAGWAEPEGRWAVAERGVWRGRGTAWRAGVVVVAVALLVAGLATAALVTDVDDDVRASITTPDAPDLPAPAPGLLATGGDAPAPDPAVLRGVLEPLATDPAVGRLTGRVVDDATGQVLWERDADRLRAPASTAKLLTAVAALSSLPPDARAETTLAEGADGALVVIPGGDPTMSGAAEPGRLFPEAGTVARAVEIVRESGLQPQRVVIAPGPYGGDPMAPGWSPVEIAAGNVAPIEPWMLDAGRVDPEEVYSPRLSDPMLAAGRTLAGQLGVAPEQVEVADGEVETTRELGRVASAPLTQRLRSMLVHSDNVLAETLCREVALHRHPDQRVDFAAGTTAVLETLSEKGVDVSGVRLEDCSGLSSGSRLSAAVLTDVLRLAAAPDASRDMRELLDTLPVAGATGSLAGRFDGPSGPGAGWVRAKTGTLRGVSTLAGTVTSADGRSMSFALLSSGTAPDAARPVLDRITAELRTCGCR